MAAHAAEQAGHWCAKLHGRMRLTCPLVWGPTEHLAMLLCSARSGQQPGIPLHGCRARRSFPVPHHCASEPCACPFTETSPHVTVRRARCACCLTCQARDFALRSSILLPGWCICHTHSSHYITCMPGACNFILYATCMPKGVPAHALTEDTPFAPGASRHSAGGSPCGRALRSPLLHLLLPPNQRVVQAQDLRALRLHKRMQLRPAA